MRVALLQTGIVYADPGKNLARMADLVEKSLFHNPDVVVLPEMWNTSYALSRVHELADRAGDPCAKTMGELAGKYGVNIIAGSVADLREDKVYNTSYVYDRRGELVTSYSKVHLFGLMRERDYLTGGSTRAVFELDGVKCGLLICYDLRFPELARALALDGAVVLFIPAQWPNPCRHPWKTLLMARAIENQLYTVGVNRVGKEGKAVFFGNSLVVDPLGEVLAEGSQAEEILVADLDIERIKKIREHMTCFRDRIPAAYE